MNLTREQQSILAAAMAKPCTIMMTVRGSPNDQVWRALVDRGMLEAVTEFEEPNLRAMAEVLDLTGYRLSVHVAQRAADFKQASQPMGNA